MSIVDHNTITEYYHSENINSTKGLDICERFYHQVINPLLLNEFINFQENHSAALIGYGSEVLGFDTLMSRDHDFAPRVILFLRDDYYEEFYASMKKVLDEKVPLQFEGIPCRLSYQIDPHSRNPSNDYKGDLLVRITTIEEFFSQYLLSRPKCEANNVGYYEWLKSLLKSDYTYWLSIPQQKLLASGQAGRIYYDCGILGPLRTLIGNYYPDIVWIYQIMVQLSKISQEAPFVGRCGMVGDRLGCYIQTGKIVREIMCLCFLLERKYYPYPKWFGSGFNKLSISQKVKPLLEQALQTPVNNHEIEEEFPWKNIEINLEQSYKIIVQLLNEQLVDYFKNRNVLPDEYLSPFNQDEIVCQFWGRPFVSFDHTGTLNAKLRTWIKYLLNGNEAFAQLLAKTPKGSIDQAISQVEILESCASYQDYQEFLSK